MKWRCPGCGQVYQAARAEAQGYLCLQCGVILTPVDAEADGHTPNQPARSAREVTTTQSQTTGGEKSPTLHCPSCHRTYTPEEAGVYGYLCSECQVPLQPYPVLRLHELRPGQEWSGQNGGRYLLQGIVGHGGQAQVWRAQVLTPPPGQEAFPREVALKIYLGQPERFAAVLDIYALLARHPLPHVVPLLDHGQEGPWTFLVFPLYPWGHVRAEAFRTPRGGVNWALLQRLVEHITDALAAIHSLGIVHRDIKPSNLFLEEQGNSFLFVLGDFGMATLHSVSGFRGTLLYTPPEAFLWTFREGEKGEGAVLPAWDWWSFGVTLAELIAREHPFRFLERRSWGSLARYWEQEFRREEIIEKLQIPEGWALLLRGLLTRNPELRWNHLQVRQWLRDPYSVPVPEEPRSLLVVNFRGQPFYSFHSLAWDAWEHWEQAKEHFIDHGRWIELAARLPDARRRELQQWMFQRSRNSDAQLAIFLWVLASDLPLGLGAQRSWSTLEALVQALAQGEDLLIQQLREQRLFSAYFALTRGQAYEGLASRWQAGWVPVLQAWEEETELRPLLIALLLSPEYMEEVRQSLLNHVERFLQQYLCAPEVAQELQQAAMEIQEWSPSRPELHRWETALRTVEQRPREALQQGLAVSREHAQRMLQEIRQKLQQLLTESLPADAAALERLLQARELLQTLHRLCQQLDWTCWHWLQEKTFPFVQKLATENISLLSRQAFEQEWQRTLKRVENFCQTFVPLGEDSRKCYQEMWTALQQANKMPASLESSLERLELLSQLRKRLEDAQELAWKPRDQILAHLRELHQHWCSRMNRIVWPTLKEHPLQRLRSSLEFWCQQQPEAFSNLDLAPFEEFWQHWQDAAKHLLSRQQLRIWSAGIAAQVLLVGVAALLLPRLVSALYPQAEIAVWQAWTWLIPLISLFLLGSTGLALLPRGIRTSNPRRWIILLGLYIWTITAWVFWIIWFVGTGNWPLEEAIGTNLLWTLANIAPLILILKPTTIRDPSDLLGQSCATCGCLLICWPIGVLIGPLGAFLYYPVSIGWWIWLLALWGFYLLESTLSLPPWLLISLLTGFTLIWAFELPDDLFYPQPTNREEET